jgi:DNA processing protein
MSTTEQVQRTDAEAWALLLTVPGLGPARYGALLAAFGSAPAILKAAHGPGATRIAAIVAESGGRKADGAVIAQALAALAVDGQAELDVLRRSGLAVVTLDDPTYPARLRAIEHPPPVLLVRGAIGALNVARSVAVVGTRRPTERGRLTAARIAGALSRAGATVVSGLAVGIDGAAHAAVVAEQGRTVAVLGSGHEQLFPRAHARLAHEIIALDGAVVSEFWPDVPPTRHTFPRRNRLISALADATIVVEAGTRSGALITARQALEQGRELFVVPGALDEPRSAGCLAWLREFPGEARVVATIPGLIEDLGLLRDVTVAVGSAGDLPTGRGSPGRPSVAAELIEVGPTAAAVGRALVGGLATLDELVAVTGHPPATVLGAITLLELRGLATSTYGRYRAAGRLASADPA